MPIYTRTFSPAATQAKIHLDMQSPRRGIAISGSHGARVGRDDSGWWIEDYDTEAVISGHRTVEGAVFAQARQWDMQGKIVVELLREY